MKKILIFFQIGRRRYPFVFRGDMFYFYRSIADEGRHIILKEIQQVLFFQKEEDINIVFPEFEI